MKKPPSIFKNFEGTILIFSLVVILGGAIVLAAWAQMLATRAIYTTMTQERQKQRIAIGNGRSLARQYVLTQMPSSASFLGTNYALANGWGGFDIQVPPVNPWTNTNISQGNPFNPFSDVSFVAATPGHISNAVESIGWTFLLRSRSPLLTGYPVTIHNPGSTSSASGWATNTYKIYWSNALGFSNAPVIPFTSGTNLAGAGTNGYIGYFASPLNTNAYAAVTGITYTNGSGGTATSSNIVTNGSKITYTTNYNGGNLTIMLTNTAQNNSIMRYDAPTFITNRVFITNTSGLKTYITTYSNFIVTNLTILGSTVSNVLYVTLPSTNANPTTLTLSGTNNTRNVYVARSGQNLTLKTATYTNNYTWWLGMSIHGDLTITGPTSTKSLTLQGGIRSDGNVTMSQGGSANLHVVTNSVPAINGTNAANIELVPDRILWLEDQRTQ